MTSDEALAAVSYLATIFGFALTDAQKRAYLRIFVKYDSADVRDAIHKLSEQVNGTPSPNAIEQEVRKRRPAVRDTRNHDPVPEVTPTAVSEHVAAIKSAAGLR